MLDLGAAECWQQAHRASGGPLQYLSGDRLEPQDGGQQRIPIVGVAFDNPVQHELLRASRVRAGMSRGYPTASVRRFSAKTWSCSGNSSPTSEMLPSFRTRSVRTTRS